MQKTFGIEPGQGSLSQGRFHQRAGDRLLHSRRAGAFAALERPATDDEALSRWRGRRIFLRKELSIAPAELGEDGEGMERRQSADHALLPCQRSAYACLGR